MKNFSRYYRLSLTILWLVMAGLSVQGQNLKVTGRVTDTATSQILEDATISLFRLPSSELLHNIRSSTQFEFASLRTGKYLLVASYQGYFSDSSIFTILAKDSLPLELTIALKPDVHSLLQVVVHASIPPAIVRKDTIAFNTGAYPSPPNSTVEDILRKLPGIEIDKDGNITMQGQKVDKITLDGKDFFLYDLRTASQTLPADLIAQVEVFNTQSQKSKLTGIKSNSNTKTLNLKLKKKLKSGYFGKAYAGIGTEGSYSAGANATRLNGNQMLLLSGNANNINNQFIGNEHQNGPGIGEQSQDNVQLNYRDDWTKKLNATINTSHYHINSLLDQQLNRQTILTDSSIVENRESETRSGSTNYSIEAAFEYAIDSLTQINLRSNYYNIQSRNETTDTVSILTQKLNGNYLSSIGKTDNTQKVNENTFMNSLDFRKQFAKKGRQLYFNISQNSSNQDQPADLLSGVKNFSNTGFVLSNTNENQQSTQTINNNRYNLNALYTEPVGPRHVLDFGYSLNHSNGHSDKESYDYDSLTGKYDIPDSLTTNRFLNHNTTQGLSLGYNTTEGKYRFQIGLTGQLTQLNNLNLVNDQNLHQQSVNWFPRASLIWDMEKGRNMTINYNGNSENPAIEQLQPIPDLTNPYLIKIGNPNLKQQLTHDLSVRYSSFNVKTFENWQLSIYGDYTQNQITSSSTVLAGGVQELEYVNVQGVYHTRAFLTYGFPLGGQKNGNASISAHGEYGHDISLINGEQNTSQNIGVGGSANINFHVKDFLFIDSRINLQQTYSNYSLAGSPTTQTLNENYSLNLSYRLPGSVTLASYYSLQVTGSQQNLPAHTVSLWNASINKSLFQNHCEVRLSAYDLLNSANSFTQSTGVNYVQTQSTNLQGRIMLFSLIYRFRRLEG